MPLVDKHPDHDPDCDDAQGATSRFGGRDLSRIVSKKPSEILRERRQRMRRRYLTTAGVVLALALSAVYVWGPFHSPHKPKLRSRATPGPTSTPAAPPPSGPTEPTSHGNWTMAYRVLAGMLAGMQS